MKPTNNENMVIMKEKSVECKKQNIDNDNEPATFETAIGATKFGKYNIILIIITIPAIFATMFETTAIAYVVPVAQCDLDLNLEDKGYLISATYLGMLSSAMIWGFLSDTLGRRKVIVIGLFVNGFFVAIGGLAQSFTILIIAKFMGGFIINGPYAISTTIISEYHSAKHRARAILTLGIMFSVANITLPILSFGIFSAPLDFELFNGFLKLHSWNIFILITAIPSFLSSLGYWLYVPETPKFLMTCGNNEEALNVLKKVYSSNTGQHPDTYPIKTLIDETKLYAENQIVSDNKWVAFKNGFAQMKPLFMPPYLSKITLVCSLKLGTLMGLNSLRLWLPQLFAFINDYKSLHNTDADICTIIDEIVYTNSSSSSTYTENLIKFNSPDSEDVLECTVNYSNSFVYVNLMIISIGTIIGYLFVGILINLLGKKILYVCLGVIAGVSSTAIYFSPNAWVVTALSTTCLALSGINSNVLLTIIVDLFPTTLRTMAVAIALMIARTGSMIGNVIFPYLITAGCFPPFIFVGSTTFCCALLAILLPKTDMKALQ